MGQNISSFITGSSQLTSDKTVGDINNDSESVSPPVTSVPLLKKLDNLIKNVNY